MAFIRTIGEDQATGATADLYARARAENGYLPNMTRVFGHRPEVMAAWGALAGAIRGNMPLRRYELVTLAAARELRSSYCMLAHGRVARREGLSEAGQTEIARTGTARELDPQERAVMAYAAKVVRGATDVTAGDVDGLRSTGLSDAEIFDVAAAAAVRCFFSKTLDALGAEPDRDYGDDPEPLRSALSVGRQIEV